MFGVPGVFLAVSRVFRGIMGCSRGVSGLFRAVPGCSGGVPGCSGVFRGVPGCSGFYRHPGLMGFTVTLEATVLKVIRIFLFQPVDNDNLSSYIVGGTRAFFKMLCYQTQLYIYFPSDGFHLMVYI